MKPKTARSLLSVHAVGMLMALLAAGTAGAQAQPDLVELEIDAAAEQVARGGSVQIDVLATIASGWHINGHKPKQPYLIPTELSLTLPPGIGTDTIHYPPAEEKAFAFSGKEKLLVYEGKLGLATVITVPRDFPGERVRLEAVLRYQACNDVKCLPPTTARTERIIPVLAGVVAEEDAASTADDDTPGLGTLVAEEIALDRWVEQHGWAFTVFAVALLGLGLNLTPCVYPLISVTLAYFGGQSRQPAAQVRLALVYVLGIALSFSAVGLIAALSGGLFGAALQQPPVIAFIAIVLVVLALSCFGVYEIRPPAALMRWAGGAAQGTLGALFMGLTMGIVAAPCVGPVVIGLLVFVGSRQDPYIGFLLFFVLALGMGAPYVVLALAAGSIRRLPRSGEWLVWTERLFGCVLLSMAAYFIAPLTPAPVRSYLLPTVIALSGLYLGFVEPAGRSLQYFAFLKRAIGTAFIALALWLGLPSVPQSTIAWASIRSVPANGEPDPLKQPLLIDFAAEWCIPCREMDYTTYVDPEVLREAERFRMVKADITEENEETLALVEQYQVRGVPTVILFSSAGEERRRMVGYVGPSEMLEAMREVR